MAYDILRLKCVLQLDAEMEDTYICFYYSGRKKETNVSKSYKLQVCEIIALL